MSDSKVEIFENDFKWIVRVCEDGQVTERIFHLAEHARSWAAGQEIRIASEARRRGGDRQECRR